MGEREGGRGEDIWGREDEKMEIGNWAGVRFVYCRLWLWLWSEVVHRYELS